MKKIFCVLILITVSGCTVFEDKQDQKPAKQVDNNGYIIYYICEDVGVKFNITYSVPNPSVSNESASLQEATYLFGTTPDQCKRRM